MRKILLVTLSNTTAFTKLSEASGKTRFFLLDREAGHSNQPVFAG
jgi:hypothetical protein